MKKIITAFLLIVLVSSSVTAQNKAVVKQTESFSLIISVGENWSIFSNPQHAGNTLTQAQQVQGFTMGIAGNWPLLKNFSLQAGLRISQKGSKTLADTPYYHVAATTRPMYVQLPVGFEYNVTIKNNFKLFAGVGGYIARGIGGKSKYTGVSGQLGDESNYSSEDKIIYGDPQSSLIQAQTFGNLNKTDYGINGVIGIQYWKLRLAVGYEQGLSAISYGASPNVDAVNKSISLTVGFKF